MFSPFAAVFNLPLSVSDMANAAAVDVRVFWGYLAFVVVYNGALLLGMMWLFQVRWRVSD